MDVSSWIVNQDPVRKVINCQGLYASPVAEALPAIFLAVQDSSIGDLVTQ